MMTGGYRLFRDEIPLTTDAGEAYRGLLFSRVRNAAIHLELAQTESTSKEDRLAHRDHCEKAVLDVAAALGVRIRVLSPLEQLAECDDEQ